MIGVISIIKSKRKNKFYSIYLKEAYMKLLNKNFNYKSYYYGNNENEFHNYLEIKAVADWLLFKNIKSKNKKNIEDNSNTYNTILSMLEVLALQREKIIAVKKGKN